MQGHMWSETMRTSENMDNMIFPRLLALAERAWHKAPWENLTEDSRDDAREEDWKMFANTLGYKELRRLEEMGIKYRVPPPGARVANSMVETSVTFPGLTVQYSDNGGTSWSDVTADLAWGANTGSMLLRTVSLDGGRFSREIELFEDDIVTYIGDYVQVTYNVLDNINRVNGSFKAQVVIKNTGPRTIKSTSWQLYFYSLYLVEKDHFPYPYGGFPLPDCAMTVSHKTGTLFYLSPDRSRFTNIPGRGSVACTILIEHSNVAKTDMMPNWYVSGLTMGTKLVENTAGEGMEFVGEFDTPEKWKRNKHDQYSPFTPRARYDINSARDLKGSQSPIVPTPLMSMKKTGSVSLKNPDWSILQNANFQEEIEYLKDAVNLDIVQEVPEKRYIRFAKVGSISTENSNLSSTEAYSLDVNPETEVIEITAVDRPGAFYAIQTLLALMDHEGTIHGHIVMDEPRYGYRGVMLDVARHFKTKAEVIKMLDAMAMYKLNKLHLHLADSEGWRLEIAGLPELTELGAYRCHDLKEERCLFPSFGSGPYNDTVPNSSGFYTTADYQEILQYAGVRHIQVIPEIDSPAHSRAAVKAMKMHEKRRSEGEVSFSLSDPKHTPWDPLWLYDDTTVNPCVESTYSFYGKVMDEIKKLHETHQPLTVFHVGGDEVPKNVWEGSTVCDSFIANHSEIHSKEDLKPYFMKRLAKLSSERDLKLAAWEDGVIAKDDIIHKSELSSEDVYSYAWNNIWEWGRGERAYTLANSDYKVILSLATHLYFDIAQEPDPEERGLYWATRYTDTQKAFNFIPGDIYKNADVKVSGEKLTQADICGGKETCVQLSKPGNVIGIQGQLWSEELRTSDQLDHMAFPRLIALAERAWHQADWEKTGNIEARDLDWEKFANTLGYQELHRLDKMGVKYRVPPPGAVVENNRLLANSKFPGLKVERSVDNGKTWLDVGIGVSVNQRQRILLRTRSADDMRSSRSVVVNVPIEQTSAASPSRTFSYNVEIVSSLLIIQLLYTVF